MLPEAISLSRNRASFYWELRFNRDGQLPGFLYNFVLETMMHGGMVGHGKIILPSHYRARARNAPRRATPHEHENTRQATNFSAS